jgi:hypothetical protein
VLRAYSYSYNTYIKGSYKKDGRLTKGDSYINSLGYIRVSYKGEVLSLDNKLSSNNSFYIYFIKRRRRKRRLI